MRFHRAVALLLVLAALSAPVAIAFGFDDGAKPPRGILAAPYNFTFKGRNGCPPYTFVFQNGSLPPGLSMNTQGVITGVPTALGHYSFWMELRDSGCRGGSCPPAGTSCSFPSQRPFTIDIVAPLRLAAPSRIVAENGVHLTATTAHADGGKGPYRWDLEHAPDWLAVDEHGAIRGTPDKPGRFKVAIALTDSYEDRTTLEATLIVKARLAITTSRLGTARVGQSYRALIHANGGVPPFHWSVTSARLPVGLRLDTDTGLLTGKPQKAGTFPLRVNIEDTLGITSSRNLTLEVATVRHHRDAAATLSVVSGTRSTTGARRPSRDLHTNPPTASRARRPGTTAIRGVAAGEATRAAEMR